MPCKFADALGAPDTGAHQFRLGDIAVVDFLLTLAVAIGLSYIPGSPPLVVWLVLLLLLAIIVHGGFCTQTSVNQWLYASPARTWTSAGFLALSAIAIVALREHSEQPQPQ